MPSKRDKWGWCVFVRGNAGKGKIFYYQLRDPDTGAWTTARSTRTANKKEAERIAKREAALRDAEKDTVEITSKMGVVAFAELFYDWDKSPWLTEKRERDMNALQSDHVRTMRSYFTRYLKGLIGMDITLTEVTPFWLGQLQRKLRAQNPRLKPQTINAIFSSLTKALRYAAHQWIIPKDPTEGIIRNAPKREKTGIFTQSEIESLVALGWISFTGKIMFLVGIHTGLRMGEILALRKEDLEYRDNGSGRLYLLKVNHSWSKTHGLKCPKNGKTRTVPIPEWLWEQLESLVGPGADGTAFLFASSRTRKPVSDKLPRAALAQALASIGITEEQQAERNLRFHSTRHYFNSMMAPLVQNESLRKVIGHSSPDMTDHYHHVTDIELRMVKDAQEQAFPAISVPVKGASA